MKQFLVPEDVLNKILVVLRKAPYQDAMPLETDLKQIKLVTSEAKPTEENTAIVQETSAPAEVVTDGQQG